MGIQNREKHTISNNNQSFKFQKKAIETARLSVQKKQTMFEYSEELTYYRKEQQQSREKSNVASR